MTRAALPAIMLGFIAASALNAQRPGDVRGSVSDQSTREPVAAATVTLLPLSLRAATDANGRFEIETVPAGTYQLRVVRIGYSPATRQIVVDDARRTTVDVSLSPQPIAQQEIEASVSPLYGEMLLGATELGRAQGKSAADVIGRLPGVTIVSTPGRQSVSIRGSTGEAVLVLLDGVPLNDAIGGVADLSTLPATMLQSVRVLPGAQSARFGPRAEAGVVLLTTRSEVIAPATTLGLQTLAGRHAALEVGGSQLATWSASGDFSTRRGRFDFELPPEVGGGSGTRQNADSRTLNLAGTVAHEHGDGVYRATAGIEDLARGLPGKGFAPSPFARQTMRRMRGSLSANQDIGSLDLDATVSAARQTTGIHDDHPPFGLPYDDHARGLHFDAATQVALPLARTVVRELHGGANVQREDVRATSLNENTPGALTYVGLTAGARMQHALRGGVISLTADARADRDALRNDILPSHAIDLGYNAGSLRVNVAQRSSYSPPTLSDLFFRESVGVEANPDLMPERVPSEIEAGGAYDARLRGVSVRLSATAYHSDVHGLIVWSPDYRFVWSPRNEDVHRAGGEAELQIRAFSESLILSASHSLVRLTYDRPGPAVQVAYRPRNSSRVAARIERPRWRAEIESRYTGSRNTAPSNDNALPGFWSTSFDAARKWTLRSWSLETRLAVTRVFDERDTLIFGYPDPGRIIGFDIRISRRKTLGGN